MKRNSIYFDNISPFQLAINYVEIDSLSPLNQNNHHIHNKCEIYINLTGDVSFMVENRLYPVTRGNAIITRPNEYHHCIYNSNAMHKHFWILFSAEGNEPILDLFFRRNAGEDNLISLPVEESESLISVCFELLSENSTQFERYAAFFRLLQLLKSGQGAQMPPAIIELPTDVSLALEYVNAHLADNLTITTIAKAANVSVNTLERHFRDTLRITPTEFIKRKRLSMAAELLKAGYSVLEAGLESGFCDSSHFILLFRKNFGITPFKYQKQFKPKN